MERKRKKEEQQRFAWLDVSKLDDPVEGARAKTTKYDATKYTVNVFQGNFCIKGLVKKYRGGCGPEHFEMWWLENT